MTEHGWKHLRIQGISQNRNERKKKKQYNIENEENIRKDVEPVGMIWYLMKQDWYHSRAHGNYEPPRMMQRRLISNIWNTDSCYIRGCKVPDDPSKPMVLFIIRSSNRQCFLCFLVDPGIRQCTGFVFFRDSVEMSLAVISRIFGVFNMEMVLASAAGAGAWKVWHFF